MAGVVHMATNIRHRARFTTSSILVCETYKTVWPGEEIELNTPNGFTEDTTIAVEPHTDCSAQINQLWRYPTIAINVAGKVRILNTLDLQQPLKNTNTWVRFAIPFPRIPYRTAQLYICPTNTHQTHRITFTPHQVSTEKTAAEIALKNTITEGTIQEVELELLHQDPSGHLIS